MEACLYRDPRWNTRPADSAERGLLARGFRPASEMEARLHLAARTVSVAVLHRWTERYPRGTVQYAMTLEETPDGEGHPSHEWPGAFEPVTPTLRELIAARERNAAQGRYCAPLAWYVAVLPAADARKAA
jgi:hypothetical protein